MPGRDGRGPEGRGPGTGRGMGTCVRARGSSRRSDRLPAKDLGALGSVGWQDLLARFCLALIDKPASRPSGRK
jgi:hypothetical protein